MGGEADLLREHIGFVLSDVPQLVASIRNAIDDDDARTVGMMAHRLKSLVSSYDHTEAKELCQSLESDASTENLSAATGRLERLEHLMQAFTHAVDDFLQLDTSTSD